MAEENKEPEPEKTKLKKNPFIRKLQSFDAYRPNEEAEDSALWGGKNAPEQQPIQLPK